MHFIVICCFLAATSQNTVTEKFIQEKYEGSKVHSLNSGKVSIQIQLKALPELSEWTLNL